MPVPNLRTMQEEEEFTGMEEIAKKMNNRKRTQKKQKGNY